MTDLVSTFSALADVTRLGIVERLIASGEMPAGELVNDTSISAPAVSRHLKVLRQAGLIQQRSWGNRRLYSVRPESLKAIADWTTDHRAFWEAGLQRLETLLAEESND